MTRLGEICTVRRDGVDTWGPRDIRDTRPLTSKRLRLTNSAQRLSITISSADPSSGSKAHGCLKSARLPGELREKDFFQKFDAEAARRQAAVAAVEERAIRLVSREVDFDAVRPKQQGFQHQELLRSGGHSFCSLPAAGLRRRPPQTCGRNWTLASSDLCKHRRHQRHLTPTGLRHLAPPRHRAHQ